MAEKRIVDLRNGELIDWLWFQLFFCCNVSLNSFNPKQFFPSAFLLNLNIIFFLHSACSLYLRSFKRVLCLIKEQKL